MALDTRGDRLLWGVANLVAGALCIPFCYGLSSKDFTSFKFLSAALGVGAGLNSVRLFYEHEQGAGVRSAWRASAEMVSGAWIEQIAQSNLPPIYQAPVYQLTKEEDDFAFAQYLSAREQYQPATKDFTEYLSVQPSQSENLPDRGDGRTQFIQNSDRLLGVELPAIPNLGIKFFDWRQFRDTPQLFPHIRGVASTGCGKTTLFDWLMDVVPCKKQSVITVKRWPHQWIGLEVTGVPENYHAVRSSLEALQDERVRRTELMAKGIKSPTWNVAVDEWKAISRNVKAVVDRKTKQIISLSAKQIMGEMLTLARESNIRIFALAQGRQVVTWGLEGESDLAECFCSIYLGKFAIEECESYRNKFPKDSEQYAKYQQVRDYLETLGNRAAWISSGLGEFPAVVPDLSRWRRQNSELPHQPSEPSEDLPGSFIQGTVLEPEIPGSPLGMPGIDLEATLSHILNSEGKYTVYAWDWGATDAERFELARLIISRNLGVEKTILHLWGVTSGGRNHQKYVEARKYLDRLLEQIKQSGDSVQ